MDPRDLELSRRLVEAGVLSEERARALTEEAAGSGRRLVEVLLLSRQVREAERAAVLELAEELADVQTALSFTQSTPTEPFDLTPVRLSGPELARRVRERIGSEDRFRGRKVLGQGGMGQVVEVFDSCLERPLALKFLLRDSEISQARFLAEAQITAQLDHPNIVPIHDIGIGPEGQLYFTMKRVKGRDLESVVHGIAARDREILKAFPVARRVDIFKATCRALAYAHSRGVVHRDLKPANVMVGEFGEVLVLDWGLAKCVASEDSSVRDPREELGAFSAVGNLIGTPRYMAPEQIQGRPVTPATDVYALGCILYCLLSGTIPFEECTSRESLFQHILAIPPHRPSTLVPQLDVPAPLEAICLRCLEKDPNDRYPNGAALLEDVERYQSGLAVRAHSEGVPARTFRWVRRHPVLSTAAVVFVAALLAGGFGMRLLARRSSAERTSRALDAAAVSRAKAREAGDPRTRVGHLLQALSHLATAQAIRPDDDALKKQQIALLDRTILLALETKDYSLAEYLVHRTGDLGRSDEAVSTALEAVETSRTRRIEEDRERISVLTEAVRNGKTKPIDAVFETVAMRDRHATEALLEKLKAERRAPDERVLHYLVRALGRLGHGEAVEPLLSLLRSDATRFTKTEAILALCHIGDPSAVTTIRDVRFEAGSTSNLWRRTEKPFNRLVARAGEANVESTTDPHMRWAKEAEVHEARGEWEKAVECYTIILGERPEWYEVYINRGLAYGELERFQEAVADFTRAIELRPGDVRAYINRGSAWSDLEELQKALADYTAALEREPDHTAALNNRAGIWRDLGKPERAISDYNRVLELNPTLSDTLYNRALCWEDVGNIERAIKDYKRSLSLDPEDVRTRVELGRVQLETERYEAALESFTRALERNPNHAKAWLARGVTHLRLGHPERSAEDFERSLKCDPNQAQAEKLRKQIEKVLERPSRY